MTDIRFIEVGRWDAGTGQESLVFSVNGKRVGAIFDDNLTPEQNWDCLHDYFRRNPPQ